MGRGVAAFEVRIEDVMLRVGGEIVNDGPSTGGLTTGADSAEGLTVDASDGRGL